MSNREVETVKLQTRIQEYVRKALDRFIGAKLDMQTIENIRQVPQAV